MAARLKERYQKEVRKKIQDEFGIKNIMAIPKIDKVVINMGIGEAIQNMKVLDSAAEELAQIAGQKPVITRAKKSIANFKIRENMPIGMMVTLRGERMYEFLDRFLSVALPRIRDFQGAPANAFDGELSTAWSVGTFGPVGGQRLLMETKSPVTTDGIDVVQAFDGTRRITRWA